MTYKLNVVDRNGNTLSINIDEGTTIRDAIEEELSPDNFGICGGSCACGTCHIYVHSNDFDRLIDKEDDIPAFLEKKLIEACFEACRLEGVVGMQDLGAAGLTSAAIEVAHKSNLGLSLDVSRVPVREKGMSAYEIMLSESQERMILIVKKEYNKNLNHLFSKWDLESKIIGSFIKDKKVEIYEGDNLLSSTPIKYLVEAPSYKIVSEKPKRLSILQDE